jgi:acyl transferase domain-containing protein/thioesterase domain-containing protein/acyl carrier protein
MSVRLPGATDVATYWNNLRSGLSSIRQLSEKELIAAGVPESRYGRADYVPFAAPLDGFSQFDAEFFGLSPKEAAVMDPQHRQFLETAWEAMENAGHPPESLNGQIGVYAGCGMGSYFYFNVCSNRDLVQDTGMFLLRHTGNDKDFMATRASHIFDLKGPSIGMQTACSTSLVAIHYAAQALNAGDCDMALAGGVTIELPQGQGYMFKKDEILSPDGICRAFDHKAEGTVFGSGAGVVALRRLEDAIADGDHIWAVIKGSAVNNDGAVKASYLAPSVEGQSEAILKAHASAGIDAETVGYIECHGTGTYLGDPIEVAALTEAFRETTDAEDFCRIGSVKTNIGHLDTAAGVASLVKASLALYHKEIPPSLNFEAPNPAIEFDGSPFRVNAELTPWEEKNHPRRAGVNSLGVGGTNAHTVLEEAPVRAASEESDWPFHLLPLSARTKGALDQACDNLAAWFEGEGATANLADVAFTLKEGRHGFDRRRVVVAETAAEAAELLREKHPRRVFNHTKVGDNPDPVFMFPGGGAQYAGMARDLYETEPVFREWMDKGLSILEPQLDYNIRALWLPEDGDEDAANATLQAPSVQLPLIMITEYALAQLWISWGVSPTALIGHSMGENTAACVAGVMTLEDCIGLVLLRGRLFETVEKGGMLSVPLSEEDLRANMGDDLDMASVNSPGLCVVSGTQASLDKFEAKLAKDGIEARRIQIDIAAHSHLLEPILGDFGDYLRKLDLKAPKIPFVSNRTGGWITDDEATDPDYWVSHLRNTIHFRAGLSTLATNPNRIYIEVGPGVALASLTGQHDTVTANQVIGTLRHPEDKIADDTYFMAMLGRVWATGAQFDWSQIWGGQRRNRLVLPTYPFQHNAYFIEPQAAGAGAAEDLWLTRLENRDDWAWRPIWKPVYPDVEPDVVESLGGDTPENWLIFEDETGLGADLAEHLRVAGHKVTSVVPGDAYAKSGEDHFSLAVERGQDSFDALLADLAEHDRVPTRIVHGWLVTGAKETARPGSSFFHRLQEQGFWSLFHFARAWGEADGGDVHLTVLTSEAVSVGGESLKYPEKSTVSGPARVIPHEFPGITIRTLDVANTARKAAELNHIFEEVLAKPGNGIAALRNGRRYEQIWRPAKLPEADAFKVEPGQTVILTGGLGGIGLTLTEALVKDRGANVAILTRSELPPRTDWDRIIRLAPRTDRVARRLRRLMEIDPKGEKTRVIAADVSNLADIEEAKAEIEQTFGPVNGVIHAAGVIADGLILGKDPLEIDAVFTPKVYGTQVISEVFPDGALDWMVLFSSSSTATAPAGQIDYVAANEYLNALAFARQGGKTRIRAIDWGPWAEVGMAIDALEGVDNSTPVGEPTTQPLLDAETVDTSGNVSYLASWTTSEQWVLDEHRTRDGDALLPGTGYIELAAEALAASGEVSGFEIADLTFLTPLRTPDDTQISVKVDVTATDDGHSFEVFSAHDGETYTLHAEARLARLVAQVPKIDIESIKSRLGTAEIASETETVQTAQAKHLAFGPRWQVLQSVAFGKNEGLAELQMPMVDEGYRVHPGMMDLATGFGLPLVENYAGDQFWVPLTYGKIRIFGPMPERAYSWIRIAEGTNADSENVRFDISIADESGQVVIDVEGFTVHRLTQGIDFAKSAAAQGQPERTLSPAEERLKHTVEQGILPRDGAEMFFRAMASDHPQVLISSLNLEKMIEQVEADSTQTSTTEGGFERPDLDSEFVEPENEVERQLAEFWTDLLGVSQIGVEDNFFDLGGHSLIAVRLFAKVKAAFSVDFPISILFEAPTIRKCANLIIERVGDVESPAAGGGETEEETSKFLYIVPMHGGEPSNRTPFFMVAGMFGNVLNLRHLGHLIGADRPFYGLQARGLLGGVDPHTDLVDAARDYIEEMRQIQPHGPYMLGGFSGGGITAMEIARQLRDAGEEIASLIMLDTPLPRFEPLSKGDRLRLATAKLKEGGITYPITWAQNRIRWEMEKRRAVAFETSDAQFHNEAIRAAFMESVGKYQVHPWEGPLTMLRPPLRLRYEVGNGRWVNEDREYVDPDNFWRPYVPSMEVIEVPGDHDSMVLEPNVRVLVVRMRRVLEDAERGTRPTLELRAAE